MPDSLPNALACLQDEITLCTRCPRLRAYGLQVASQKRQAYRDESYWGRPVSGFGDPRATIHVVGLAPGAHGAHRTGRVFTGDESGRWLYRTLHRLGWSNQPDSRHAQDELRLQGVWVSCIVRCAPPDNRPNSAERRACLDYLDRELQALQPRIYVALGQMAFETLYLRLRSLTTALKRFGHGEELELPNNRILVSSYHPSQQNTYTGKLTRQMWEGVWDRIFQLATLALRR